MKQITIAIFIIILMAYFLGFRKTANVAERQAVRQSTNEMLRKVFK